MEILDTGDAQNIRYLQYTDSRTEDTNLLEEDERVERGDYLSREKRRRMGKERKETRRKTTSTIRKSMSN
uniref:Uncharacterized protein n=1 Tax=Pristionchus pacificus TaxID=54126 RepID=A0A2A6C0C3_PRIPA|eukprot:PDM71537.1 hypothetical protein PRIPAC_37944 [Pristionchus pacificus]